MKRINAYMDEIGEYVIINKEKFYLASEGISSAKEIYYELSVDAPTRVGVSSPGCMVLNARKEKNLTQKELAKMLDIKQNTLSRYENETRQMPFETFEKAMNLLGYRFRIDPQK